MKINNLPKKYEQIWKKALPLLKQGRPGDDKHAVEVAEFILNYKGKEKLDLDILIPTAIMHDIGHSAILPEHFKFVTGPEKIMNAKLVHMLVGAKIAKDMLDSIKYDKLKTQEIVDIISIHDSDQLKEVDISKIYNTENKKIFHDVDLMDRFNQDRVNTFLKSMGETKSEWIKKEIEKSIDSIFHEEFKKIAQEKIKTLNFGVN